MRSLVWLSVLVAALFVASERASDVKPRHPWWRKWRKM